MAKYKWLSCLISATLLIGCGGDESSPPSEVKDTILAPVVQNNFTQLVLSDGSTRVSLADNVTDPQGLPVTLESVVSLTDACADPEFDSEAMTFEVAKENQDTCYFEYTVKNHASNAEWDKTSTADSYVLVSDTVQSATLPPISQYTAVNQDLRIELETELAGDYPTGYILDQDVVVLGSGNAYADTANNAISYVSQNKGVSRILYSLTSNDGLDTKAGYVDVAVSAEGNNMPVAGDFERTEDVKSGVTITVDVAGEISDPDGDALQLTDAYAFNADAVATDQESLTNTSFNFTASGPGAYDVSYYVTDHRGGYAVGIVRINVEYESPWDDITLSNNEFYAAPWEKSGADAFKVSYQTIAPETINGIDYDIPLFNHEQAESVCLSRGMLLPTASQLDRLFSETGNVQYSDSWPVVENYWSDDPTTSINLATGSTTTTEESTTPLIATCVYPGKLEVSVTKDNAYISESGNGDDEYNTVRATVKEQNGSAKEGAMVYMYSTANLEIDGTVKTTDSNGNADFDIRSTSAGPFDVFVRYYSQELKETVTFILNEIVDLIIEGDAQVSIDEYIDLTADAVYTNGEEQDVTDETAWGVDYPNIATIDPTGRLTGLDFGKVTVTGVYNGEVGTHTVDVIDGWGDSGRLEIDPPQSDIEVGDTVTYTAKAYSAGYPEGRDVTGETDFEIITGSTLGTLTGNKFTAQQEGTVEIGADYQLENGVIKSDEATITISSSAPTLESISVTGPDSSIEVYRNTQLTATAYYSDGSYKDVTNTSTWDSSDPLVATVTQAGFVEGIAEGTTNITAEYQGKKGGKPITVQPALSTLQDVGVEVTVGATTSTTIKYDIYEAGEKTGEAYPSTEPVIISGEGDVSAAQGKWIFTAPKTEGSTTVQIQGDNNVVYNTYVTIRNEIGFYTTYQFSEKYKNIIPGSLPDQSAGRYNVTDAPVWINDFDYFDAVESGDAGGEWYVYTTGFDMYGFLVTGPDVMITNISDISSDDSQRDYVFHQLTTAHESAFGYSYAGIEKDWIEGPAVIFEETPAYNGVKDGISTGVICYAPGPVIVTIPLTEDPQGDSYVWNFMCF